MDSEDLHLNINYVGSSGIVLSTEQKTALQVSLSIVKSKNNFKKVFFWGKILGIKEDYFIIQGTKDDLLKNRTTLYSNNCIDWSLLAVDVTAELLAKAEKVRGRFRGDPSYDYEVVEVVGKDADGGDEEQTIQIKEEDRLACVIQMIDKESAVTPRGAYKLTTDGQVLYNENYQGMQASEAVKLGSYLHFYQPENLHEKCLLAKANHDKALDFLPAIDGDIPNGIFSFS